MPFGFPSENAFSFAGIPNYTYVNPNKVASSNPGYCFIKAGWRKCGVTKQNKLLIFEITSDTLESGHDLRDSSVLIGLKPEQMSIL